MNAPTTIETPFDTKMWATHAAALTAVGSTDYSKLFFYRFGRTSLLIVRDVSTCRDYICKTIFLEHGKPMLAAWLPPQITFSDHFTERRSPSLWFYWDNEVWGSFALELDEVTDLSVNAITVKLYPIYLRHAIELKPS